MSSSRRPRRDLNPTFAAAHGLRAENNHGHDTTGRGGKRLDLIVKEARATGKLHAVNVGLMAPLPNELFDFKAGMSVDLSMEKPVPPGGAADNNEETAGRFLMHTEETLTVVDLSDNDCQNSCLDERVLRYEHVQVMRWKRCRLQGMDVNLSSLEHLLILDLSGNQLRHFQLGWLPLGIQELDLSRNQLEGIESNNMPLDRIQSIDLSENKLSSFDSLGGVSWSKLQVFRCHHNPSIKACSLDLFFSAQHALRTFDMAHCQLGRQAERMDFTRFSKLQTILLGFNRLSTIPTVPTSVTRLDLTTNRLVGIQGLFPQNDTSSSAALLELLLQDNHLEELDAATISKCVCLRRLDLTSNKLKTIPYQIGFLGQLQHISLTGNPLHTFKASEIESTKAVMEKLRSRAPQTNQNHNDSGGRNRGILSSSSVLVNNKRSIQLSGQTPLDLGQLVAELQANPILAWDITGQLLLDGTLIDSLPDDLLSLLPNVTVLSLRNNKFQRIPSCLTAESSCPIGNLTRLFLCGNLLTNLDGWALSNSLKIVWTGTLTHLGVSSNRITSFPGSFLKELTNLQVLNLAFNKIKSVEDWQSLPSTLKQLDLSENSLESMDNLVLLLGAHCPQLEVLRLHNNYIARIPYVTGLLKDRCPALTVLDLKANPQHSIRPDVLSKTTEEQLTYLFHRLTAEQRNAAMDQMDRLQTRGGTHDGRRTFPTPTKAAPLRQPPPQEEEEEMATLTIADKAETSTLVESTSHGMTTNDDDHVALLRLADYRSAIVGIEKELDNPSLSQAKRYALKRSLAMEHSKLIREERRLGLRK